MPLVELGAAPMQTKFGKKSKPVFKVVGWKRGGESEAVPLIENKKPSAAAKTAELIADEIPF